jgi:hypothetical protein
MLLNKTTILKKMLEADIIDRQQVSEAESKCRRRNEDLYEYLVARVNKSSEKIKKFYLENFNCHKIILSDIIINPRIANMVPPILVVNHLMIPAFELNRKIFLAVSNPLDIEGLNKIMKYTGEETGILLTAKEHILEAIDQYIIKPKIASILK